MAKKSESDKPEVDGVVKAPAKKKMLLLILGILLIVGLLGGGALLYIKRQYAAMQEGEGGEDVAAEMAYDTAKTPPVYLPLENLIANLADPGGERVAQIGITLEVLDSHASDNVRAFLPTIRSAILMLVSQRTADELLTPQGKDKLAKDILVETLKPFSKDRGRADKASVAKKQGKGEQSELPVLRVLFSSFIVQ